MTSKFRSHEYAKTIILNLNAQELEDWVKEAFMLGYAHRGMGWNLKTKAEYAWQQSTLQTKLARTRVEAIKKEFKSQRLEKRKAERDMRGFHSTNTIQFNPGLYAPMTQPMTKQPASSKGVSPWEVMSEEYMKPLGLTALDVSRKADIDLVSMRRIMQNAQQIQPYLAIKLGKFFKTTPEFWLNLQHEWNLRQVKSDTTRVAQEGDKDMCESHGKQETPKVALTDFDAIQAMVSNVRNLRQKIGELHMMKAGLIDVRVNHYGPGDAFNVLLDRQQVIDNLVDRQCKIIAELTRLGIKIKD